jgi:two-component system nitrogen regulation response regulator GlnG
VDTSPAGGRSVRVLIAEDDADAREALCLALRQTGAEVDAVADGGRLLVALASHYRPGSATPMPDLIVTDVIMPVCSGLSVFEALRAAHWSTPVIVISAIDSPTVRSSAASNGATFMLKPIDLGTFLRTAQRLIAAANPSLAAQV